MNPIIRTIGILVLAGSLGAVSARHVSAQQPQKLYTFTVSGPQANTILKGLLELPAKEVMAGQDAVYPLIVQQIQAQDAPPAKPPADPPKTAPAESPKAPAQDPPRMAPTNPE